MSTIEGFRSNDLLQSNQIKSDREEYDEYLEIAQSNFADMLHDWERNQKYRDGLKVAIERIHQRGQKANVRSALYTLYAFA